jgi:hypothetical protein
MLVYYLGCNSAWCGYTGGVVYSRTPTLDPSAKGPIQKAAARAGINFESMCATDNACALKGPRDAMASTGNLMGESLFDKREFQDVSSKTGQSTDVNACRHWTLQCQRDSDKPGVAESGRRGAGGLTSSRDFEGTCGVLL